MTTSAEEYQLPREAEMLLPGWNAGWVEGRAVGRAETEHRVLTQQQFLDELVHRLTVSAEHRALAEAVRKAPTHLELVQRRHFSHDGPVGPNARALLEAAARQHLRIWDDWPGAGLA